jgi:asparagine synthase (glutamine-hydrolysing)
MTNLGFQLHIQGEKVQIQSHLSKDYDSIFIQSEFYDVLFEGLLLNKKQLLNRYAMSDFRTLMLELVAFRKEHFISELEGEFRGCVWDKRNKTIIAFTNPTATQRVFYTQQGGQIFIDSHLHRLTKSVKEKHLAVHPNSSGIYQLIALGGMLENTTIVENVYKIYDGHYIKINVENGQLTEHQYFGYFNEPYFEKPKEQALKAVHEVFSESVKMEYEKDTELNADHLALLSGGLDSRVAVMYAQQMRMKPDHLLCFSQSDYLDHRISEKIAHDDSINYEFIALDGGVFLNKIDELTRISDGLTLFTGGLHVQHAMDMMRYKNFKIFHSGQIGDGILGGFNSAPKKEKPSHFKMVLHPYLLPKIAEDFQKTLDKYESQETCLIRNLAFNRVLLGAHVLEQKAYQTSPFMTKEFLKLAISLPEKWKFNHAFYIEWIKKYCPKATQYPWERTLLKPDAVWKTKVGDSLLKPLFIKINEKIMNTPHKASMYPYSVYYNNSWNLQQSYQNYFDENIYRLDSYTDLQKVVLQLFNETEYYPKARAINVLSVFKLFFNE